MGGPPIVKIAEAVAEAKGVDPNELTYALEDYIDTEALQRLTTHSSSTWTLSFQLPEHEVVVTSCGFVYVDGEQGETET